MPAPPEPLPDGVRFVLRPGWEHPREQGRRDVARWGMLVMGIAMPVLASGLAFGEGLEAWAAALFTVALLVSAVLFALGAATLLSFGLAREDPAPVAVRPWGLEIGAERVPFDGITSIRVHDGLLELVTPRRTWTYWLAGDDEAGRTLQGAWLRSRETSTDRPDARAAVAKLTGAEL
ncbi:MAG: hypothetical protein H6737_17580 [Alphaproteobacteria bacterium]|nr:hypothetical protein [Alphaproteobacteria bacterium]